MVEIPCRWSYRPGWINCTSTLPEQILSISTISAFIPAYTEYSSSVGMGDIRNNILFVPN